MFSPQAAQREKPVIRAGLEKAAAERWGCGGGRGDLPLRRHQQLADRGVSGGALQIPNGLHNGWCVIGLMATRKSFLDRGTLG